MSDSNRSADHASRIVTPESVPEDTRGTPDEHSRAFVKQLAKGDFDLDEFDTFLEDWQKLADEHGIVPLEEQASSSKLHEIEGLAKGALERLIQRGAAGGGYAGSSLFKSLQVGAAICDAKGNITQSNDQALQEFGLHDSAWLGDAQLELETGDTLNAAYLAQWSNAPSELNILQCYRTDGKAVNLAILSLGGDAPSYLIVFMNTPWGPEAQDLLASRFGLSEAEAEIIGAFASGVSIKQIAADRGRAYATIRNQFQAVLEKTGCPNQADLLRLLLGTSYLFSQIQSLVVAETPALGKAIEMVRPKGRILDVQMFGDLAGQPFICLPSIFGLPITPDIDAKLKARGLLMIGIARPGIGGTSPPADGQTIYDCLARDIAAVLDSMEIERCVFLGRASAARSLFKLCEVMPERITRAIMVNGMVPQDYVSSNRVTSKWTRSLISASKVSAPIATLILGAGNKLRLRMGDEKFIRRMYRRSASDTAAASDPHTSQSIGRGVEYVTRQGLNAGAIDMIESFADWRGDVEKINVPCTLFHGKDDPHVPITAVRAFAEDFPDTLRFIAVEDGGGLLNYTHTDTLFDMISAED